MEYNDIEGFILNSELREITLGNQADKVEDFIARHPGKESLIRDVILLYKHLEIKETVAPDYQIEEDCEQVMEHVRKKRKRRMYLWSSVASAAACILIVFLLHHHTGIYLGSTKEQLFSQLESLNMEIDQIQIISGESSVSVHDNAVIEQTQTSVIVDSEEKIKNEEITTENIQLVVPNGKRTSIKFSDGTTAWVNSGTKLIYSKNFSKDKREIYVDGEIYLEVTKDTDRPFLVHSKKFDVTVLGTTFNVNTYSHDEVGSVVLVEGRIEVRSGNCAGKLEPNEGYFYHEGSTYIKTVDVYPYICWREGIMQLRGETLGVILNKLSRHYNIKIECSEAISGERYAGKLDLNESLDEILYNLSLSTQLSYTRENDTVYIK